LLHITDGISKLLPHDPEFFGLASVVYDYRPAARCRRWKQFLNELWPDDQKAGELLQEWFGYCLLPDTSQQKLLGIIGPPRSGKSTIARVLRELIGRCNVASPSIRSLSGQFGLWGMLEKSVAIVPDATLPHPCPALEELLKSISGEDAMDIHRKGMPPLTGIRLPTRIVILANEQPAFHDPSGALQRRLITLRTRQSFSGKEDITLTDKLLKELPGILNWAIEGWKRLHSRGRFEVPENLVIDRQTLLRAVPDGDRVSRIVVYYQDHPRRRRGPRLRHNQKTRQASRKRGS
jgi:putative DNA primase/helicase